MAARRRISSASPARSGRVAPSAAAASRISSASSCWAAGSGSVQAHTCGAHDGEIAPATNPRSTAGCAARRRIQPTAPAAAPIEIWVCHFSHARALC
ncbi:MAG TPA: hypothetical protein VMH35_27095 [Streptosporangiaceae bacterium]|nr:hypothetical protein [Streptosporangiaceae bacterium]